MNVEQNSLNILDFGALPDGSSDSAPAFKAAVEVAKSNACPTVLYVPPANSAYLLSQSVDLSLAHDLTIVGNNTLIVADGNGLCFTTLPETELPFWELAVAPLTGTYSIGTTTVELASERDGTLFHSGDAVIIRTGGCAPGLEAYTPLAELNVVETVDKCAIHLRYPLSKPFRDRGDGLPFGISNGSRRITRGLTIRGLILRSDKRRCADLVDCLHLRVEDCLLIGRGALHARGRFISLDYRCDLYPRWDLPIWRPYYLALDTCTSDVDAHIEAYSAGSGIIHVHEGVANARLRISAQQGASLELGAEHWPVVSVRGLSWNVAVDCSTILNSPAGPAIISAESSRYPGEGNVGLRIAGLYVGGTLAGPPIVHFGETMRPIVSSLVVTDVSSTSEFAEHIVGESIGHCILNLDPVPNDLRNEVGSSGGLGRGEVFRGLLIPFPRATFCEVEIWFDLSSALTDQSAPEVTWRATSLDGSTEATQFSPMKIRPMEGRHKNEANARFRMPVLHGRIRVVEVVVRTDGAVRYAVRVLAATVSWFAG